MGDPPKQIPSRDHENLVSGTNYRDRSAVASLRLWGIGRVVQALFGRMQAKSGRIGSCHDWQLSWFCRLKDDPVRARR